MKISLGFDPDLLHTMLHENCKNYVAPSSSLFPSILNHLGDDSILEKLISEEHYFCFGFDAPARRRELDEVYNFDGFSLLSENAIISSAAKLENGVTVADFAYIGPNVYLSKFVKINVRTSVHHDTKIGKYSVIGPSATICGRVCIAEAVFVGAGATVLPGISVGENAIIGAGAVVVEDVPPNTTVIGVPAKAK